jgi:hypothetical protein
MVSSGEVVLFEIGYDHASLRGTSSCIKFMLKFSALNPPRTDLHFVDVLDEANDSSLLGLHTTVMH